MPKEKRGNVTKQTRIFKVKTFLNSCLRKNLLLDMSTLMAREGRTQSRKNLNYKPTILAKNIGTNSKTQHEIPPRPPAPRQCCQVAVFMYSPIDFSGFQHCLGEGGLPKIRNDGTTKLMTTDYRYPEHKCTLQSLFSYLSQKILARIVVGTALTPHWLDFTHRGFYR